MKKTIWIVNYYTGTPETATHPRYLQFTHYFQQAGYNVVTFNSTMLSQIEKKDKGGFTFRTYGEHRFIHVEVPAYQGNGLKRMYSIWVFAWRLYRHCHKFCRPDVILHNIHAPFDYPIVWVAKKLQAKYIAEAWDPWPEGFVTAGLVSKNNPLLKFAYQVEKWYYYHADQIVFTYQGAYDYIKRHGWTKENGGRIDLSCVHYINNGVSIEDFDKDKVAFPRSDEDINRKDVVKVIYVGAINLANQVKTLIDAAALMQGSGNFYFFIYGNGAYRDTLEQYVIDNHIKNVVFKEKRIPFCEVAWVVSQATVNVMTYEPNFGYMGISAGKLFQYLAAGKPIVCNVNIAYDDVITDNNLGIARDIETPEAFAQTIRDIAEQPRASYDAMCERVRKTAERFDYKKLAAEEIAVIEAALKE